MSWGVEQGGAHDCRKSLSDSFVILVFSVDSNFEYAIVL